MFTVHQHWDPLEVCAVGRSYPPEFYNRIKNPKVRNVMERIAIETEEDYQKLINKLEEFNVTVIRTDVSEDPEVYVNDKGVLSVPPPMTPRDYTAMVGNTFYMPGDNYGINFDVESIIANLFEKIYKYKMGTSTTYDFCKQIEDCIEPANKVSPKESFLRLKSRMFLGEDQHTFKSNYYINSPQLYINVPQRIKNGKPLHVKELQKFLDFNPLIDNIISSQTCTIGSNFKFPNHKKFYSFTSIKKFLEKNHVPIVYDTYVNTASMTRVGKDLFFSTINGINEMRKSEFCSKWEKLFPEHNVHAVTVMGHTDGSFCPVQPGLIISRTIPEFYKDSFPDWEVVELDEDALSAFRELKKFKRLKNKNKGKWWIAGEEDNDDLIDYIETWLSDWVTYVEESVFDVNMLIIDKKNIICNGYNKKIYDAFERYGITPHVVNFRHRFFWDGGLHCITSDISREGDQESYFS